MKLINLKEYTRCTRVIIMFLKKNKTIELCFRSYC